MKIAKQRQTLRSFCSQQTKTSNGNLHTNSNGKQLCMTAVRRVSIRIHPGREVVEQLFPLPNSFNMNQYRWKRRRLSWTKRCWRRREKKARRSAVFRRLFLTWKSWRKCSEHGELLLGFCFLLRTPIKRINLAANSIQVKDPSKNPLQT